MSARLPPSHQRARLRCRSPSRDSRGRGRCALSGTLLSGCYHRLTLTLGEERRLLGKGTGQSRRCQQGGWELGLRHGETLVSGLGSGLDLVCATGSHGKGSRVLVPKVTAALCMRQLIGPRRDAPRGPGQVPGSCLG